MQINYTFDPATWGTAPSGYEAQAEATFGYAVNLFDALFINDVTLTIRDVYWGPTQPGSSAENHPAAGLDMNYAQVLSDLQAHEDTPVQQTAFGSLPTTDPTGSNNFIMNPYQAEALGVTTVNQLYLQQYGTQVPGGTITFNSSES